MAPEDLCGFFNTHIPMGLKLKPLKSEMNIYFFASPEYQSCPVHGNPFFEAC